jgi:predicted O-linked N-acetylglucosamine transferase (SPINDLY family)
MTIAQMHDLAIQKHQAGQWIEAENLYRQILAAEPGAAQVWNNLGAALQQRGVANESLECFQRAVSLQPDFAEAHYNLGIMLDAKELFSDAAECYRRALALKPDYLPAYNNLANALLPLGQARQAIATYDASLKQRPDDMAVASNRLFALHFAPQWTAEEILREHQAWDQQFAHNVPRFGHVDRNVASSGRLRVGYVSPNFREHCQAMYTVPLLEAHDRQRVEMFCYSDVAHPDAITARLKNSADVWRSTASMSDDALAKLIHADRIDVLVDLTMRMCGGRPLLFARKPAPVSVTWLAYPGTSGLAAMDYRLTDPYLDPPGMHEDWYCEKSIRLPDTFWCYDPRAVGDSPEAGPLPAMSAGHITFGCLNNFCKVNEGTIGLWSRVLLAAPRSRLRLLAPDGLARQWAMKEFILHGVDSGRVDFVPRQRHWEYMNEFCRIDLGLDTLPYNGHTTSLDSFWMGVPIVTRIGATVVGRAGYSQLSNLGLTQLAAKSDDEFVKIAVELAGDLPRLSQLRRNLRPRMLASPLMDARRFARNMEAAYRRMMERSCIA